MRALLINTAFLGDVIFCAPLVENLVRAGYVVDAVTRPGYGALLLLNGEAITYDKRGQDRGIKALLRLGRALRGRYELVLGAHPSVRSGLLAALIKAPRSFGWGPLGYRVRVPRGARFVEDAIALGVAAGVPEGDSRPQIAAVPARLAPGTIALVPGSRVATKRWPHWAALAPALAAQGHPLVWLGGAEEAPLAVGPGERAFGRSLQETASILKGCSIAVGGRLGPLAPGACGGHPGRDVVWSHTGRAPALGSWAPGPGHRPALPTLLTPRPPPLPTRPPPLPRRSGARPRPKWYTGGVAELGVAQWPKAARRS